MTVADGFNPGFWRQLFPLFREVLAMIMPAVYCERWVPWVRIVLIPCVVVVLIIIVRITTAGVGVSS